MQEIRRWWAREIDWMAAKHQVPAHVVAAVIKAESDGKADAFRYEPGFYQRYLAHLPEYADANPRRVAASYGLMQVMYTTAVEVGYIGPPEGLFLPLESIEYGCRYLAQLLRWADGDVARAIAAYNGGRGNWQGERAQDYAARVLRFMGEQHV